MRSTFDEFRNRVGQAVACSSFMSLTENMDLSVSFASTGSVGAGQVRGVFEVFSSRRSRLGGFVKEHQSEEGVVLPPFSTFIIKQARETGVLMEIITLSDVQMVAPQRPLFAAAEAWEVAAIRQALSATPASVNVRDEHRRTLLHLAAWNDRVDVVGVLCECCVNPDPLARKGCTPLWHAAYNGAASAAKALLAWGCDRSIRCGVTGRSPLEIAMSRGHQACAALLADGG
jgi:hypothetical protein